MKPKNRQKEGYNKHQGVEDKEIFKIYLEKSMKLRAGL